MSKRLVTILTVISILTIFPNEMVRVHASRTFIALRPTKEKNPPCAPCAAGQNTSSLNSVDNVAVLGRRTQPLPLLPIQDSIFDGATVNLVSTATGHLKFAVNDLEVSGAAPLMFQRAYNSGNDRDVGLGVGWSFVFDDRISLGRNSAQLSTGTGSVITFRGDAQSQRFVLKTDAPNTRQSFEVADENTIVEQSALWTRTYKKQEASYRLSQITDLNGNTIAISFNAQGNVSQIASSSGGTLTLEWSGGKNARLLAVTDNSNRRVRFNQDGRRLRAVTDSAGAQWTYDYQDGHLTQAADPLNRVMLRALR